MRISFLKEYVVLVEEMSYTEASKRLFITQSTLSKHMAALESDLKATLIVRDASGLHLTEIGKAFYDDAVAMVNAYANTLDRVAALKEGRESVLKVGYVNPVAQRFIGPISSWYAKHHPEIDLRFTSLEYRNMARALANYEIDVALTIDADAELKKACTCLPICDGVLVVALPMGHRLAKRDRLRFEDLESIQMLVPDAGFWPWTHYFLKDRMNPDQFAQAKTISDLDTLLYYVESGQGAAVVTSHNMQPYEGKVEFRPLEEPELPHFLVSALWLKETERHANASKGLKWIGQAISYARTVVQ